MPPARSRSDQAESSTTPPATHPSPTVDEPSPSPLFAEAPAPPPGQMPTIPGPGASSSTSPGDAIKGPGVDADPDSLDSFTRSTNTSKRSDLLPVVRRAVKTAGGVAHALLTRGDLDAREAGVWLPDQDDVNDIAHPVAGLASRRAPEGAASPDARDLLALIFAALGYVVKQIARLDELAETRAPAYLPGVDAPKLCTCPGDGWVSNCPVHGRPVHGHSHGAGPGKAGPGTLPDHPAPPPAEPGEPLSEPVAHLGRRMTGESAGAGLSGAGAGGAAQ